MRGLSVCVADRVQGLLLTLLLVGGGGVCCVVLASHSNAAQGTNDIPRSALISHTRCDVLLLLSASRLETATRYS
jgi:hypothetical protein